VNLILVCIC